jgi:hypothetical protein
MAPVLFDIGEVGGFLAGGLLQMHLGTRSVETRGMQPQQRVMGLQCSHNGLRQLFRDGLNWGRRMGFCFSSLTSHWVWPLPRAKAVSRKVLC